MSEQIDKAAVIAELQRELGVRIKVYPKWVEAGRLSSQTALFRIEVIKRAIELLQPQETTTTQPRTRTQLELFKGE